MWKSYGEIIRCYPKISLLEERRLIAKAQKGSKKSQDEIVLCHIGFLMRRIRRKVFPHLLERFGEDLLEESILIIYKKIKSYNLYYCNKKGEPHPVKFISYIWKRIDGFILDYLKKELNESNFFNRYNECSVSKYYQKEDMSSMSTPSDMDIAI